MVGIDSCLFDMDLTAVTIYINNVDKLPLILNFNMLEVHNDPYYQQQISRFNG